MSVYVLYFRIFDLCGLSEFYIILVFLCVVFLFCFLSSMCFSPAFHHYFVFCCFFCISVFVLYFVCIHVFYVCVGLAFYRILCFGLLYFFMCVHVFYVCISCFVSY